MSGGFAGENELGDLDDDDLIAIGSRLKERLLAIVEYQDVFAAAYPDVDASSLTFAQAANRIAAFEADHWTLDDRSPIVLYGARGTREPFVGFCAHECFCSVRVVQTDGAERLECTCEHALRGTSNELG